MKSKEERVQEYEDEYNAVVASNRQAFVDEVNMSHLILRQNRHNSRYPYSWYGPDSEPMKSSRDCPCMGCSVRFDRKR